MHKRSRSKPGSKKNAPVLASSQERAYTRDQLVTLRNQLGTNELAKRMGIPAPSLRRMLGKGKSAGLPKQLTVIGSVQEQIKGARRKPEIRLRELAGKAAARAEDRGTLDIEYLEIAKKYQQSPREVYTLGKSPDLI